MSKAMLRVRLSPKFSQNRIAGWKADVDGNPVLSVSVTEVPEKGKANKALINLLATIPGVAKSSIEIVSGQTDRNKILVFNDISEQELLSLIEQRLALG